MSDGRTPRAAVTAEEAARKAREARERLQKAYKILLEARRRQIITSELIH